MLNPLAIQQLIGPKVFVHRWSGFRFLITGVMCILGLSVARNVHAERQLRLGVLAPYRLESRPPTYDTFIKRLSELGWRSGQNLLIVDKFAEDHTKLPLLAGQLAKEVDVILAPGTQGAIARAHVEKTAIAMQIKVTIIDAANVDQYRTAIKRAKRVAQAAILFPDATTIDYRKAIVTAANETRLPMLYGREELTKDGGLVSFGPDMHRVWMRIAYYVDRLLRGAKPQELPIEQPAHFKLVLNLRAAKAIGLVVPYQMQLRSDEVMQ